MSTKSQRLIILCGIPFSGKSYFADQLVKTLECTRIDLDEVKFKLYGQDITDEQIDQSGWDTIYQQMYQDIDKELAKGKTVVHDTGNFTIYERGLIRKIAKKRNIPFVTIFVDTPIDIARKRLKKNRVTKKRFDISNKAFQEAVDEMESPIKRENPLVIKNTDNFDDWIKQHLHSKVLS